MFYYRLQNQRGQSLVQVVLSIGIMGILMAAFMTMMRDQSRETRALSEKLAAIDLQQTLTTSFLDGSVCKYVLNSPTVLTFDSTKISATNPVRITLPDPDVNGQHAALFSTIFSNPGQTPAQSPGPIVAQVGQPASPSTNSLIVRSIQLELTSGSQGIYKGSWIISFDSEKTIRAVKPVSISTLVTADISNPEAAFVVNCQSTNRGSSSGVTISVYGSGDRCKDDATVNWCSNNPEMGIWTYELCEGWAWAKTYDGSVRWNNSGNGYVVVPKSCAEGSICPFQGANPYKIDAFCLKGFQ